MALKDEEPLSKEHKTSNAKKQHYPQQLLKKQRLYLTSGNN